MAAPMREGAPPGGGRPAHPANFDDDNEWDIGIGDLIIDLDADIEKTDEAGAMATRPEPDAQRTALKMKIKRTKPGTKSSEAKHEIVKSNEINGEAKPQGPVVATVPPGSTGAPPASPAVKRGSGGHRRDKTRDKHHHPPHEVNGLCRPSAPPNAPGPPDPPPVTTVGVTTAGVTTTTVTTSSTTCANTTTTTTTTSTAVQPPPPPVKKIKTESKETAEVCVGTSVGTITEPDCLGPCEPGTSVTLEGIVWHETEGGVLVVNVTWRGKTYVGTLLDCTRHDWAPPRFCDSPTEELDARTPKGRAKRGRGAAPTDMTNFTETRSSVHSKLRNGGAKGRRALPSPTPFTPPKADKRKRASETEDRPPTPKAKKAPPTTASPPPDPILLECPEPNCSKKYKHANGLKYHRSHAHGTPDDDDKEGSSSEQEETSGSPASPAPNTPAPVKTPPPKSPEVKEKTPEKESKVEESPVEEPQVETPSTPPAAPTPPPEALNLQPTQFKVKPRSALMPCTDRKDSESPPEDTPAKRRRRSPSPGERSPGGGPRSPAYSDISDDAAPGEGAPDVHQDHRPFPVYHQYYGQGGYLGPPTAPPENKKEDITSQENNPELKESKPEQGPQKVLPQHFYPYNYVQNFPYNVDGPQPPLAPGPNLEEKKDQERPNSPLDKSKPRPEKDQPRPNENHQILKESIEIKNQMGPYGFQRPPHGREEEMRRYVSDKRTARPPRPEDSPAPKVTVKQEGQKPTTETQGPPPPPTSQYFLPPYHMQSGYGYGGSLGGLLVGWGGRVGGPPPEDLSRPPLSLYPHTHTHPHPHGHPHPHHPHHHPHKIHELQEHGKSPVGKGAPAEPPPESRSPPPQRHVHTHHHTHVGLGYPIYPPPYPAAAVLASTQAVVNSFPTPPK